MALIFDRMEWVIQVEQNCKLPQAVTLLYTPGSSVFWIDGNIQYFRFNLLLK
jgi:hypothetical protein